MSWFANYFTKEGAGIPKDEPVKVGLPLLLSIVKREWLELVKLNLLFLLVALPIVTIPAAYLASVKVNLSFIADKNVYLGREFFRSLRRQFIRASAYSMVFLCLITIGIITTRFYLTNIKANFTFIFLGTTSAAVSVFITLVAISFVTALAVNEKLTFVALMKVATTAILLKPVFPCLGLIALILLWLTHFIFYPVSVFMPILFNFSVGTLILTFSTLKGVNEALAVLEKN